MQDNGTSVSVGLTTPSVIYQLYGYRQQLTANGDGQATIYGYRTRDSQNDGISYAQISTNNAVTGYNFWGDVYTFGVAGYSYNDYSRTGGVLGADVNGLAWGSLGYRSSGLLNYGVYGSAAYASGAGRGTAVTQEGFGGGFFGGVIGSVSQGEVMGSVSSGNLFASYNMGNVYTSGFSADMIANAAKGGERTAAYAVTSPDLKVYDSGSAQLAGSTIYVPFSGGYAGMLGAEPVVTVTPVGSPAQLYVESITAQGFTVAVASGSANVKFSWIAVGSRVDAVQAKGGLPTQLTDANFDAQLKAVMQSDGDTTRPAAPLWWDGTKMRFEKAPEQPRPVKVER